VGILTLILYGVAHLFGGWQFLNSWVGGWRRDQEAAEIRAVGFDFRGAASLVIFKGAGFDSSFPPARKSFAPFARPK
jgi:hypothetical protein